MMSTNKYLAFTTGPIFRTISRARKTRELWASSYIFSLLMQKILTEVRENNVIVLPAISEKEKSISLGANGAGIWPDRCIAVYEDNSPNPRQVIDDAIVALAKEMNLDVETLKPLFSIHALKADWCEKDSIKEGSKDMDKDLIPVHRINRLLDNLELAAHYQQKESLSLNQLLENSENINQLYRVAGHKNSRVFIALDKGYVRLPSLPEIALQEIKENPEFQSDYNFVIKDAIDAKVIKMRGKDDDYDGQKENEQLYVDLKKKLPKDSIAFRHKYIAIVAADGDGMGSKVTKKFKEGKLNDFSESLKKFSEQAVDDILKYGGLPIYAGGDDLLFMAPVSNKFAEARHIFGLCNNLNQKFKAKMGEDTSMSFGVSITYYKFPLGEAVQEAYKLEKKAKDFKIWYADDKTEDDWKPRYKKQALSFQVRKHSGQHFGATIGLNNDSTKYLIEHIFNADQSVENAFLSSVMHKLQNIPSLLADAAVYRELKHFRKNHFNEGGAHDKEFLKSAMKLAGFIFNDYGNRLDADEEKKMKGDPIYQDEVADIFDLYRTNIFYAMLRFKQFLIQKDHD